MRVTAQSCVGYGSSCVGYSSKLCGSQLKVALVTVQGCVGHGSKLVRLMVVHVGLCGSSSGGSSHISLVILVSVQDV